MPRQIRSVAVLLILAAVSLAAKESKPHFLAPADVDWKSALKGPPAADSSEAKADLETLLDLQGKRTDAQVKQCVAEVNLSGESFDDVLGKTFVEKTHPVTFKLLHDVASDAIKIADGPKQEFKRPRPPKTDDRVKACVPLETSGSYPSSHAMRGVLWAHILSELYPDQKEKLMARGKEIGDDRVIAGMHFPTDVAAGQKLGDLIFEKLMANDDFKTALAAAKAEVAATAKQASVRPPSLQN